MRAGDVPGRDTIPDCLSRKLMPRLVPVRISIAEVEALGGLGEKVPIGCVQVQHLKLRGSGKL